MIDIFGLMALVLYLVLLGLFITDAIRIRVKNRKLTRDSIQLDRDNLLLLAHIEKLSDAESSKSIEQTDGFLKFVSDSRDWAFTYIEDVQLAIEAYREVADVVPLSKDMTVEQAEKLSAAYDRLMNFLPEENLL